MPLSVGPENRRESGVGGRISRPTAGKSFGGGDGRRDTNDQSPRGRRLAVSPYTWFVCAKIAKIGRAEGKPTQGSTFSAGHEPT